jgi:peptidoglycan/xylan/chitin deacetylase (PgdA/CDA1 family)
MIEAREVLPPIFTLSLDTELIWGIIHTNADASSLINDEKHCRGAINTLLNIFEKHNIPATWAVVGHLFLDHCEKETGIPHRNMPRFKDDWYSYDPCTDIKRDPLYYGRDIVEKILSSPVRHEIGYHSFSHVIFSECSREVAEAEIKEGLKLAKEFGITLKSFVFPDDRIGHLDVLKENGFVAYRGTRAKHISAIQNLVFRKAGGAVDKIVALPVEPKWVDGIWEIPSSMILQDPLFHFTLIPRARVGINRAIKENKVFHVYLHPQALLSQPSIARKLNDLLTFVAKKRNEGKLQVMTMGEFASHLNQNGEGE